MKPLSCLGGVNVYQSKRQLDPRIKEMQKRIKSFEQ